MVDDGNNSPSKQSGGLSEANQVDVYIQAESKRTDADATRRMNQPCYASLSFKVARLYTWIKLQLQGL